jgi:hypothetical protein
MRRFNSSRKPAWEFDFSVRVSTHVVTAMPGGSIAVPAMVELVRGEPQPVTLTVATNWASAGITAQIIPSTVVPGAMSMAVLHITVSPTTPPGSYMLAVRGETSGTFKTSQDMVTVVVEPEKKEEKKDQDKKDNVQKGKKPFSSKAQPGRGRIYKTRPSMRTHPGRSRSLGKIMAGLFVAVTLGVLAYAWGYYQVHPFNSNSLGSFEGTYNAVVTTVTPAGTTSGPGTFMVTNGYVSDPGGTFTGTIDANGNFTGTTIVSQGGLPITMTGTFSLNGSFTIYGHSGTVSQTVVAHKI